MLKTNIKDFIKTLRTNEELILHDYALNYENDTHEDLTKYLKNEYLQECLEYPNNPPEFSATAAVWSAKLVFRLTHLILYRDQSKEELEKPIQNYEGKIDASTILSADLCLRFVPFLRDQLKLISMEDVLIKKIDELMMNWPYSNVENKANIEFLNLDKIIKNNCLNTLMIDRIVRFKNMKIAKLEEFNSSVASYLSIFAPDLWPEFKETF